MTPLSTQEVARKIGVGLRTLERWINQGKIDPRRIAIGKKAYRLWTEREVETLRRVKEKTYRKGRGRKKKSKE